MCDCAQGNFLSTYIRTTLIDCTIGVPGLSIPIGLAADSLPIGIMLQGKPGRLSGKFEVSPALSYCKDISASALHWIV